MMKPLEPFKRLAEQARRETPPDVNVAGWVMHTLRTRRAPLRAADTGWLALAAASLLLAGALSLIAFSQWDVGVEPMVSFLQPFQTVLP